MKRNISNFVKGTAMFGISACLGAILTMPLMYENGRRQGMSQGIVKGEEKATKQIVTYLDKQANYQIENAVEFGLPNYNPVTDGKIINFSRLLKGSQEAIVVEGYSTNALANSFTSRGFAFWDAARILEKGYHKQ